MATDMSPVRGSNCRTELTAFVREVVLPGSIGTEPNLDPYSRFFDLEYKPSRIHRWGIFAVEKIPAGHRVIEYTGQKIDIREVWRRRIREHLYIFWLDEKWAIDGAISGSGAEFINHSCDPNLEARVARGRIFFISIRSIAAGEELTLDYNLDNDGTNMPCACGMKQCRGRVNKSAGN
jgi:uncharacterized protein